MTDDELRDAFDRAAIAPAAWNHRAHVRVALLHVARWSLDEAHVRMRAGILRMNAAHGLEETLERGYHETLTRAWLAVVDARVAPAPATPGSNGFLERFPELLDRRLVLAHYTRERLLTPRARAVYVPPDLAPFEPLFLPTGGLGRRPSYHGA